MLKGLIIDNMVFGGPAHNIGSLRKGDIITGVDGVPATEDTVLNMLLGDDVPGSEVTVSLSRHTPGTKAALIQPKKSTFALKFICSTLKIVGHRSQLGCLRSADRADGIGAHCRQTAHVRALH
jgi:C-terminal processing protease CtpA/Prc